MTLDELNSLRFNMPIMSTIDNSLWFYDCREGNGFKIFKKLIDTELYENNFRGRSHIHFRWNQEPWKREGSLVISEQMMLEDFELIYKVIKSDLKFVKKENNLVSKFSIYKPNFHMMDLPF